MQNLYALCCGDFNFLIHSVSVSVKMIVKINYRILIIASLFFL